MKKLFASVVLVIIAVVVIRGLLFGVEQPNVDALAPITWDEARAMESLAGAIRIPTISEGDGRPLNTDAFTAFHQYLATRYPRVFSELDVEVIAGHSLLLRWAGTGSQSPILFLAHQDVVPVIPGSESSWRYPPFAGTVADGFIWGRGALDDKGSLISILESAERLLSEGFVPARTIYLAFGHDEEIGGEGAKEIAAALAQRNERLGFLLDEGGFVTKGLMPGVEGRVALVGPAEKGYVSLKISAQGEGGHASMPPTHTALGRVAKAIARLEENPFPADLSFTRDTLQALGSKAPFIQRLVFANLWLLEPLAENMMSQIPAANAGIRTTTAATMMSASVKDNVLPLSATAVVNFRILPGDTVESVTAYVNRVIDDPQITVSPYSDFANNPSKVAPVDSGGYRVLSEVIRQRRPDTAVAPRLVVGATDARHFEAIADASYRFLGLEVGPEELAGMHGSNERVSVESFMDAVHIYYRLMQRAEEL
ncbi:M20 family peptidase [Zhongshania aquimaris]|uniref:M20 family peptidase n=1 Tax=Zhongshania aquimaris TaxID=2857107 RepID=A0ABS6VUJ1_9GAMM|nr:M20 family peptidase [Zhongshania aquimaris]MBW2941989.1 M20 family peptidase [Zhongshania aquimaris]